MACAFAVITVVGDVVAPNLKWAALLAGVGLLVYRITLPTEIPARADTGLPADRAALDAVPVADVFAGAQDIRIFAPSAVNLLSATACEALRTGVLSRKGGSVRVAVLDPGQSDGIRIASRQLDEAVAFHVQSLAIDLAVMSKRLESMRQWPSSGEFEYRLFPYNPGFSLVLIDPDTAHGRIIVEIHGVSNQSTFSRMHVELTRQYNERWYTYWIAQFEQIWRGAVTQSP
ncbi:hypothetical protein [Spongiactinospora sp. TRM90649]|uniref:hypothetical protein n=1 Tax=Spongiactinospora sp. TRM90649 TaxID=3031114 RepID=UPI0023F8BB1E|nr:hypothetical protein [Spongiactinospora sp. TRM90649]MDF5758552.1 hypothetical protein [Spongiactinospora sp. TRM90649]